MNVESIELLVRDLAILQHVLETPDLGDGRNVDALCAGAKTHGADKIALKHREPPVRHSPDLGMLRGNGTAWLIHGDSS